MASSRNPTLHDASDKIPELKSRLKLLHKPFEKVQEANLLVMVILLYFTLASGDLFLRKLVHVILSFEDKRRTVEIAHEIQDRLSTCLRTVTVINLTIGPAIFKIVCDHEKPLQPIVEFVGGAAGK